MDSIDLYNTQSSLTNISSGILFVSLIIVLGMCVLLKISLWKVFTQNGKKGWKSLIPLYNIYVLNNIVNLPGYCFVLNLLVVTAPIYMIELYVLLGKKYNKSTSFIIGLIFFCPIFLPILAFSKTNNVNANQDKGTEPKQNTLNNNILSKQIVMEPKPVNSVSISMDTTINKVKVDSYMPTNNQANNETKMVTPINFDTNNNDNNTNVNIITGRSETSEPASLKMPKVEDVPVKNDTIGQINNQIIPDIPIVPGVNDNK